MPVLTLFFRVGAQDSSWAEYSCLVFQGLFHHPHAEFGANLLPDFMILA